MQNIDDRLPALEMEDTRGGCLSCFSIYEGLKHLETNITNIRAGDLV